ncbi:MAG: carboxypeptidase-like regulatory domain-containing protein [Terriglobales bacterium]
MKRAVIVTLVMFMFVISTSSLLLAQDVASLTGVVTDKSGAVVPDVAVRLVDTKTNTAYETRSNSSGVYTFSRVLPGPGYSLSLSKDGFASITIGEIYLPVNTTRTQNAQLQVGQVSQTIEVSGLESAVSLDTTDAVVGNNFDMNLVHELPIQVRDNPAEIMRLQPGVVSVANTDFDDPNQSRDGAVTGSRSDQNTITLDGLDISDYAAGFAFVTVGNAPVDSIQEFRGETGNLLSSEGLGGGGQIQLVTKSGSNTWHGSAYDYNRITNLEANTYFNNLAVPTVPRTHLVRNQFGASLGGPIKKDKLFFFFNYTGRRNAEENSVEQTVPLDNFRAGNIGYINNGAGCNEASRITSQPGCISFVTPSQAAALVGGPGEDAALLAFINSRYPHANDLNGAGDRVNTAGFRFNAPASQTLNDYVVRLDYNLNDKMKVFARGSIVREFDDGFGGQPSIQFPGDPITAASIDHSYAYVFGHTWTISNTKVNQFVYGETRQVVKFPTFFNPTGTTQYNLFDNSGNNSALLSRPFIDASSQYRIVPIPVFRDDFTYTRGNHTFQVGGAFKPITVTEKLVSDFNDVSVGLGGDLAALDDSVRPTVANGFSIGLLQSGGESDTIAANNWDSALALSFGRIGSVSSAFNNNRQFAPLPQGTGHIRNDRYYETSIYLQDSWRMRSDLTLTYGLRYEYDSVPYEVNGLEALPDLGFNQVIQPRLAAGPKGISGNFVTPLVSYSLGGKANNGPGFYHPRWRDFQPRLAVAWNPSVADGILGRVLGDHKTVIRAGAGIVDDHTATPSLIFFEDQSNYLLQNAAATQYGANQSSAAALSGNAANPRFTALGVLPAGSVVVPPTLTQPFTPFLDGSGNPIGLELQQSNYAIDPNLRTPYSETITFGIQRELPGNFLLETTYFGRFAHRLDAQADASQLVDFKDPASGQMLAASFAALSVQARNNQPLTQSKFFENQMNAAALQNYGTNCVGVANEFRIPGIGSCTDLMALVEGPQLPRGDLADSVFSLLASGLIAPNVGLNPQFGGALYIANKGFSNYHGLLTTLHKRMSHGLQFDLNYTYSHSLDNISAPANQSFGSNGAGGIMCDSINIRSCYGNSDFDVTHSITADGIYELPIGKGRQFASNASGWLNQIIGGWQISAIDTWHTGLAFQTVSNAFPISFNNNTPAIFNGDNGAIRDHIHQVNGQVQLFANPDAAIAAFTGPLGLQGGNRNNLRGPHLSVIDLGLGKHFPVKEHINIEFRMDAFNAFNHPNFTLPGTAATADITSPSTFGVINGTGDPRVVQFALRLDF